MFMGVPSVWTRASLSHPVFTDIARSHPGNLIEELAGPWLARCASALRERRGAERHWQAGAGPRHDLGLHRPDAGHPGAPAPGLPHTALAELYGTARSTISRAIGEIRPLLERTHAWQNALHRPARCYERRVTVVDAFFGLADTITAVRSLIRRSWTTHLRDERPNRRP